MPAPAPLISWLAAAAVSAGCPTSPDPVERLVCADAALARQEAELRRLYGEALQSLPAAQRTQQAQQQESWQHDRAACPEKPDPHACLAQQLAQRIVALQISLRHTPVFAAVTYHCAQAPLSAAYYRTEPAAVRLRYQGREAIAFIAPSGSGARYSAPGIELWEHQGVARFNWHGVLQSCPRK